MPAFLSGKYQLQIKLSNTFLESCQLHTNLCTLYTRKNTFPKVASSDRVYGKSLCSAPSIILFCRSATISCPRSLTTTRFVTCLIINLSMRQSRSDLAWSAMSIAHIWRWSVSPSDHLSSDFGDPFSLSTQIARRARVDVDRTGYMKGRSLIELDGYNWR